jgi:hypothetical protein
MSRRQIAALLLPVVVAIGYVGAWAFNPDSGAVLHNVVLWRIFGIVAELGLPLLFVVIVAAMFGLLRGRFASD